MPLIFPIRDMKGNAPPPPVKRLRDRGITVFAGNGNVHDTWSPFGNGDMLERAMLLAWRAGFRSDDDLAIAFAMASVAGARALDLVGYGLVVGCRADFFCVPSETQALRLSQAVGDVTQQAFSIFLSAGLRNWAGDYNEAVRMLTEGLQVAREQRLLALLLRYLFFSGITLTGKGDYDQAHTFCV